MSINKHFYVIYEVIQFKNTRISLILKVAVAFKIITLKLHTVRNKNFITVASGKNRIRSPFTW